MGENGLRFCVLGSSSRGNSTLVTDGNTSILIDAGLPGSYMIRKIDELTGSLDGLFISHEHIDHIRSIPQISKRYGCPVYLSQSVHWYIDEERKLDAIYISDGGKRTIGDITVTPVSLPHDAIEPFGFVVDNGKERLGIATDLGHVNERLIEAFFDLDFIVIESNYDPDMLEKGRYPRSLKERIKDDNGHLSNEQCRDLLARVVGDRTSIVILSHLSEENNDPLLAIETSLPSITSYGKDVSLRVSYPRMATPVLPPVNEKRTVHLRSTTAQVTINSCKD